MILLGVLVVVAFLLWYLLPRETRSEAGTWTGPGASRGARRDASAAA
jgi:hypothetical protein